MPQNVQGVDGLGGRYLSSREGYESGRPHIVVRYPDQGEGLLARRFVMSVEGGIPPGAEWFRLEYDWGGTRWSLTIPLTGEEGRK